MNRWILKLPLSHIKGIKQYFKKKKKLQRNRNLAQFYTIPVSRDKQSSNDKGKHIAWFMQEVL